jgi:hypothetical protein
VGISFLWAIPLTLFPCAACGGKTSASPRMLDIETISYTDGATLVAVQ